MTSGTKYEQDIGFFIPKMPGFLCVRSTDPETGCSYMTYGMKSTRKIVNFPSMFTSTSGARLTRSDAGSSKVTEERLVFEGVGSIFISFLPLGQGIITPTIQGGVTDARYVRYERKSRGAVYYLEEREGDDTRRTLQGLRSSNDKSLRLWLERLGVANGDWRYNSRLHAYGDPDPQSFFMNQETEDAPSI